MADTYFECPVCGKEDWMECITHLPSGYVCSHCGTGLNFIIVTDEELDDVIECLAGR
jgi:transcription elongation factor Elf1